MTNHYKSLDLRWLSTFWQSTQSLRNETKHLYTEIHSWPLGKNCCATRKSQNSTRQQNTSIGGIVDENMAWITKYKNYLPGKSVVVFDWNPQLLKKWIKISIALKLTEILPLSYKRQQFHPVLIIPFNDLQITLGNFKESRPTLLWRRRASGISVIKEWRITTKTWFGKFDTT